MKVMAIPASVKFRWLVWSVQVLGRGVVDLRVCGRGAEFGVESFRV